MTSRTNGRRIDKNERSGASGQAFDGELAPATKDSLRRDGLVSFFDPRSVTTWYLMTDNRLEKCRQEKGEGVRRRHKKKYSDSLGTCRSKNVRGNVLYLPGRMSGECPIQAGENVRGRMSRW